MIYLERLNCSLYTRKYIQDHGEPMSASKRRDCRGRVKGGLEAKFEIWRASATEAEQEKLERLMDKLKELEGRT